MKYNGLDLIQMLTSMLNAGNKHQILYGNYANFIRINWLNANKKSVLHYDIYAHHGAGGSAPVTKGMIDFNRLGKSIVADLIWTGHRHNAIIDSSDPVLMVTSDGKVVLKNRKHIQTPSYQTGKQMDYNINYSERFYTNSSLAGFGELNLTPIYQHDKIIVVDDLKITTIPKKILGDITSAKLYTKSR